MNVSYVILLLALLTLMFIIYHNVGSHDMTHVRSDVDHQLYMVRNVKDKQKAANLLAKIKGKPFIVGHSHVPLILEGVLYDEGDWVEHKDETHDNYLVMERGKEPKLFFYGGPYILNCKRN